jgi:signal transduction histidine kinase
VLLLEAYSPYQAATARERDVWWRFAPITLGAMLVVLAVQLPLARRTVAQVRAGQRERERLQARALDASQEERRRIAGSLHDGVVQDVSAASLLVATAAGQLRDTGSTHPPREVAPVLHDAAVALRGSVGSLRSLLVEIDPPSLERAGLAFALRDLATRLGPRGVAVEVSAPDGLDLPLGTATLLFRTAQEALRNVARHARATRVEVTVSPGDGHTRPLVLEVADDGVGLDVARVLHDPALGHLGLRVLADQARTAGARLDLCSAAGRGTRLRLTVPPR